MLMSLLLYYNYTVCNNIALVLKAQLLLDTSIPMLLLKLI